MDIKKDKLQGKIENVVYRNDVTDYSVLEISDGEENLITAVGIMPMAFEGECVELVGRWTFHKEFGKQFAFDSFEKKLPEDVDGILQFLSSRTVKGVGPVTALKIVNRYGRDSFDVIENHPEWLADIPGITLKKAAAISESFREQSGLRGVMMFCKDFMGTGEVGKVYKRFGVGAIGILKENPYVMCNHEFGMSFERADEMARSFGVPADSEHRVLNGIIYLLNYNGMQNGHTCLPEDKLISAASDILDLSAEVVGKMLYEFLDRAELASYRYEGTQYIMTSEVCEDEDYIAKRLSKLNSQAVSFTVDNAAALIEKVEAELDIRFARKQREALFASLDTGVMILTGGPGTGKTTVVRALLSIYKSIGARVVLAAPTGRAAKRMSEATSEEAKTVHRLLEVDKDEYQGTFFSRNAKNPLREDVVIVDEASMLDLHLMASLMRALSRGTRLVLIGDSDQLPSVGAGNVLSDMIRSERIKTVELDEIFRQSKESLIVTNAHRINEGEAPLLNVTDSDFFFVRRDREDTVPETIASLVTERLPKTYGKSIKDDIQVISPSRKGIGGVDNLNAVLQEKINPPAKFKREHSAHGTVFREGDRVMQVQNNYEIEWEKNGICGMGLFNGDIGVISEINERDEKLSVVFDDKIAVYDFDMLDELELSYAITVHKSQGSEYPVVIVPMYSCPIPLMTRNLFYTAVTRAKRMVILVGRSDIAYRMVENNREVMRYTMLCEKIIDYR
ncbi:MAG: ATP-dependent RecD-like DNA helicase [Clostridia bacterium]|nr:ATP-dependent RecD-like DNA helicase [Clostridia bacterium]MBP3582564.1 ATP-dependent RecD-like DNA helicase [Clostridia bacterium]